MRDTLYVLAAAYDKVEDALAKGDVDAQRFYERHGFVATEPGSSERAFYYWRELAT